ncbi:hypothetical protein FQR65_LT02463 [Abscondita terminalis]|nr:hypothetical protein FQR65_LT02463 [Abscondita terminalis]
MDTRRFYSDHETCSFYILESNIGSSRHLLAVVKEINCTPPAINEFPSDGFTRQQRQSGWILIHVFLACYAFVLLAIVCDDFFVPAIKKLCDGLHLTEDVAGATFMAIASSSPELFINSVGTFITQGDIGVGTIVGSAVFNILAVPACCGLIANMPIQVDWWPVTRDCFLYLLSVTLLVVMTWDGMVYWYEGMVLFIVYFMYFTIMFNNTRISNICKRAIRKFTSKDTNSIDDLIKNKHSLSNASTTINLSTPPIYIIENDIKDFKSDIQKVSTEPPLQFYSELKIEEREKIEINEKQEAFNAYVELNQIKLGNDDCANEPEKEPLRKRFCKSALYVYTLPIKILLYCMLPDPKVRPKLFPITFILCIVIIGVNSYIISWMITIIGSTFKISDTVLGLTFLAAGACLPEAISIILMSRKGEGSMGVSNALGANTMNILLSLGLPWFIKTMIVDTGKGRASFIEIASGAIEYTILSLILVVCALYITLYFTGFKLQKRTGIILAVIYLIFLSCTIAAELLMLQSNPCSS